MKYKENKEKALEKLLNKQQEHIENMELHNQLQKEDIDYWKNKAVNNEFVIDSMQKESDQAILSCKFITDILLLIGQLEKILSNDTVLSQVLLTAITTFKLKLTKAMQTIQYDGLDSFTFDPYINDNNDVDNYDYE